MSNMKRVEVRQRSYDGKFAVWVQKMASDLWLVSQAEIKAKHKVDGPVWVCIGVYDTRKEIFA